LRREAEGVGELPEPAAGVVMERTLCLAVICNGFRKSKLEDVLGMIGLRERMTGKPGDALSSTPGLAHSPAPLSL
jgi:hypothetical protein